MSFSIIIPVQNAGEFLSDLLDDIDRQSLRPSEVLLCDNNSSDGAILSILDKVESYRFILRVLSLDENLGFTGAVNKGVVQSEEEVNFILNADLRLGTDFFAKAMKGFDLDTDIIGVRVMDWYGKNIESEGLYLTRFLRAFNAGSYDKAIGPAGSAFAFRKNMLKKYKRENLLDRDYFFLWEDVELACFIQENDVKFTVVQEAVCFHFGNSGRRGYFNRQYRSYINRKRVIKRYFPGYNKRFLPVLLIYDIPRVIFMLFCSPYRLKVLHNIKKSLFS